MNQSRSAVGGPQSSSRRPSAGTLAACSSASTADGRRHPAPVRPKIDAALQKETHHHRLELGPSARRRIVEAFEKKYPKVDGQARERRHRQRPLHEAPERDQGRQRRPRRGADRVLRAPAVRALRFARRPDGLRRGRSGRNSTPPGTWGSVRDQWRHLRRSRRTRGPWPCSTARMSSRSSASRCRRTWDEYLDAARKHSRRRSQRLHRQRHRRPRIHHRA